MADVVNNQLSKIRKVSKKIAANGTVIEENDLEVQGANLEECKKIFDKIKSEE